MLMTDLEEEWKAEGRNKQSCCGAAIEITKHDRPVVYLADLIRYVENAEELYAKRKEICGKYGLDAITPLDWAGGVTQTESMNPYTKAANLTENYLQLIKECDAVVADLNNFRGYECANDVGFECGMGFELNRKLYGYMEDVRPCIEKIPHLIDEAEGFRDMTGSNIENFNYPANLMFGSSMEIYEGKFEDIISKVAKNLKKK